MQLQEVVQIITSEPANNLNEVFLKYHKVKVIRSIEKLNNGTFV